MTRFSMMVACLGLTASTLVAAPREAQAFCGFYVAPGDKPLTNDASMVALMREGTRTVISMSNNYKGPAANFAMVVPVPVVLQKENVKTLDKAVFTRLETLSSPRLVEYWEQDPCNPYPPPMPMALPSSPPKLSGAATGGGSPGSYGVKIEAKFSVGEYDILILSAKESDGLERFLIDSKYNIPKGAAAALAPYIKEQQKFFVAKIDIKKVAMDANGVAILSPLRFSYESQDFRLPVRLGLLNAPPPPPPAAGASKTAQAPAPKQDLIVYILSKTKRYELANYPNVFIPTNLEVTDDTKKTFASFYAALFDEAVAKGNGRGIVTEYAWDTPFAPVPSGGGFGGFGGGGFPGGGGGNYHNMCDPCPPMPLTNNTDLTVLGGDVLYGMGGQQVFSGTNVVLTRLHARYDSTSLSDDLIFKSADPVVGGRETLVAKGGEIEKGAQSSTTNNFQARYIIRHKWAGAIACKNPQRGVWGGPTGSFAPPPPTAATNLASATRGSLKLASYLKAGMPAFDVKIPGPMTIAPPSGGTGDADAGSAPDGSGSIDASAASVPADDASVSPMGSSTVPQTPQPQSHGCGCELAPSESTDLAVGFAALLGALGVVSRRKKKTKSPQNR